MARIGGLIDIQIAGVKRSGKGNFTYNLGHNLKKKVLGSSQVAGHTETPQIPKIEGAITDAGDLDVAALQNLAGTTVVLSLANGKIITLTNAVYAEEGDITTEEGEIPVLFEGDRAVET